MKETKYPKSFSHIGITVPDIKKEVEFYQEVMGGMLLWSHQKLKKKVIPPLESCV